MTAAWTSVIVSYLKGLRWNPKIGLLALAVHLAHLAGQSDDVPFRDRAIDRCMKGRLDRLIGLVDGESSRCGSSLRFCEPERRAGKRPKLRGMQAS